MGKCGVHLSRALLGSLCLLWSCYGVAQDSEKVRVKLTATVTMPGQEPISNVIVISDEQAFEFEGKIGSKIVVSYHLGDGGWMDRNPRQLVTLEKAKAWAEASRKRSEGTMATMNDPSLASLMSSMFEPNFVEREEGGQIFLENEHMSFVIQEFETIPEPTLRAYLAYDELNAYRKAMVLRKVPPYVQLAVDEVLRRRKIFPKDFVFRMKTNQGVVQIQTKLRVERLSPEDVTAITQALAADMGAKGVPSRPRVISTPKPEPHDNRAQVKVVKEMHGLFESEEYVRLYRNYVHPNLQEGMEEAEFVQMMATNPKAEGIKQVFADVVQAQQDGAPESDYIASPSRKADEYQFNVAGAARRGASRKIELKLHEGTWKLLDVD